MGKLNSTLAIIFLLSVAIPSIAQIGPAIDIWYGDVQYFGQKGNPQEWINILGNVSDDDGIATLSYTLNGGSSIALAIGPDNRRLQSQGDFNIDISLFDLLDGSNTVEITAVDNLDNSTLKSVSLIYENGNIWENNYAISWDTVTNIQHVAQVVDGKWNFSSDGIRVLEPGYDRLVAIGDTSWTDYEVVFPITVNSLEAPISPVGGDKYGAGLLMRWTGHTDDPISGWQPKSGWEPLGEIGWFNWNKDTEDNPVIRFWGNQIEDAFGQSIGTTYIMKFRTIEIPGEGQLYNIKAWEQGTSEPFEWNLSYLAPTYSMDQGSFMLIAHHIDATFGNIDVVPLDLNNFPIVSFTSIADLANLKKINYNASGSSDPDGTIIAYNWDFGDGNEASGQITSHTYTANGIYEVKLTLTDNDGNQNVLTKDVLVNDYSSSTIISDDFNQPALNLGLWTFINPLADGSYNMSDYNTSKAALNLVVPGGESHDINGSGNNAVRIMQPSNNTDLQVETKFISFLTDQYQGQGILIEQDANNYIRFDFFSDGSDIRAYSATFTDSSPTVKLNSVLPVSETDTLYLKVSRVSNTWQMDYSINGIDWIKNIDFNYSLVVNNVGIFGLNAGTTSPAHTAKVDYFFNTASPIDPEDGLSGLPVADFKYIFENSDPLQINFDASLSSDPDGTITSYVWDFGDGNSGSGVSPSHIFIAEGSYDVTLTVNDNDGNENFVVKEIFVSNTPLLSDDFNSASLNSNVWSFINPKDDGEMSLVGYNSGNATMQLTVPVGVSHDITVASNDALRIMQDATDSDFDLEVKFESSLSDQYQLQGILIEQDADNFIRFDFFSDGASTRNYAAVFSAGTRTIQTNQIITPGAIAPLFLRVHRSSDNWSMEYSLDSTNWVSTASFSHPLIVNKVGVTAGNAGTNPPAFTSIVDYFFNSLGPIIPEDGLSSDPAADFIYVFDNGDPKLYNFDATPSFDTDGSIVSYDWDFGDANNGTGLQTSHTYATEGTYSVTLTVTDDAANTNSISKEISVSDTPIFSDDFNSPNLKENIWTLENPRNDGSLFVSGYNSGNATLDINVPSGKSHDVTADTNNSVRIMQPAINKDFDLEVKFESILDQDFQIQGILIEESSTKFIRFDFLSDGANIRNYAATFNSGTSTIRTDVNIPVNPDDPLYMRINRNGNSWIMEYSIDSLLWNTTATFNYNLIVSKVGVFAGNAGSSPPQFTSKIDYFFNSASPYLPEDAFSGIPAAKFSSTLDIFDVYLVNFDATASYDPDGTISTYSWDFGDGNTGSGQNTSHTYATIGTYTVSLTVTDNDNFSNTLKQDVVITDNPLVSDDFNSPTLNTNIWKFVNPKGDGSYSVTGYNSGEANISLVVPSGTAHDVTASSNDAVRIMQASSNTNFDIETKFTSDLGLQFQSQGIIIQEDQDTYIRADFLSDGTNIRNFIASYDNGSSTTQANVNLTIDPGEPMFLRLHRNENDWDVEYSTDSTNWTSSASFSFTLAVDSVGIFAGNAGGTPPSHTAVIDYFFNQAVPIVPEDGFNQKPIPAFTSSIVEGNPLNILFDASSSVDDGLITSYNWDFGDGNTDSGEIVNHVFATSGDYSVKLVLTDNDLEKDSITNVVIVNIDPIASFTAIENITAPYLFDLDASSSIDIDGTITAYEWDFGDGNTDTGVTVNHTYASAGEYEVILIVTDDDGDTNAINMMVNANQTPSADFTFQDEIFNSYKYNFDASSSIDLDGSIVLFSWDFGDGNSNTGETTVQNYAVSGEYEVSLTITDDDGATDQVVKTINVNMDPVASFSYDIDLVDARVINFDASTSTDTDGTIISYNWDFDDGTISSGTTAIHTYASPGLYTVTLTITDDDGATHLVTELIEINLYPVAAYTFSPDPLNELNIDFNAEGSSDPDGSISDYNWDFGDGVSGTGMSISHAYVTSGLYSVSLTVTDNKSAVNTIQESVNVNISPVSDFTLSADAIDPYKFDFDATSSSDVDGTIVSYSWDYGDGSVGSGVTSTHTYASSGIYTVILTVTDDDAATSEANMLANANQAPIADFSSQKDIIDPYSYNFNATTSSDADGTITTYSWDFGDGNTGTGDMTTHTYAISGIYDISLSVTDDDGATDVIMKSVNINLDPEAIFVYEVDLVDAKFINFDASGSSDADGTITTYTWDFGDGNTGTGLTTSHTYVSSGIYTVHLTVTDDDGGTNMFTDEVNINLSPVADFSYSIDAANELSILVDASGSSDADGTITTYTWDFGDGNTGTGLTTAHTYVSSGIYTVHLTVTDDDGGTNMFTDEVNINLSPVADFSYSIDAANELSILVDASGSSDTDGTITTYTWDFGDGNTGTGLTTAHTYVSSGIYTVHLTVTDDDGGTNMFTDEVNINLSPVADFSYSIDAANELSILVDASGSSDTDGTITTYTWDFGDGNTGTGDMTTNTYVSSGIYTVHLTVTDDDGGTNMFTDEVNINLSPVADFNYSIDVANELSILVDASGSSDADGTITTYTWDFGDGNTDTGLTTAHTYVSSGIYTVHLTVTDDDGGTNMFTDEVNINLSPVADFNYSIDAANELSILVDASGSSDADGTITTYTWDFGDGNTGTGLTTAHTYVSSGIYTVHLTVTDDDGGTNMFTDEVNINLSPVADFSYSIDAANELSILVDASGSSDTDGTITTYTWDFGDGNTGTGDMTTHTYTISGIYDISLSITDDDGAVTTIQQSVNLNISPNANFTYQQDTNNPFKFDFDASSSTDIDGNIVSFSWDFGDGTVGTGETVSHIFNNKGDFQVGLTVRDDEDGVNFISSNITIIITDIASETDVSAGLQLSSYPNPIVNNYTQLVYNVPRPGKLSISIHDIKGEKVEEFLNEKVIPGEYIRIWEPHGLPNGIYFTRLLFTDDEMNVYSKIIKLVLYKE